MENPTHEIVSLRTIDEVLKLPQDLESAYLKRKDDAYVGSFDHIKGKFHRLPIVSGWATYGKALREQGAIVAVKYKLPMVNMDVIPEELSGFVLEHEAVESALDINASDTQNQIAFEKVDQLGLTKAIKVSGGNGYTKENP